MFFRGKKYFRGYPTIENRHIVITRKPNASTWKFSLAKTNFVIYNVFWCELRSEGIYMKNLNLIVWLTQLGISVAAPLAGFTLLALWLQQRYALGKWVVLVGLFLGLWSAISGFCTSLRTMRKLSDGKKDKEEPPVSFNDHM